MKAPLVFDFTRMIDCTCDDGFQYEYTGTCQTCQGKRTFPKGGRNYKCKTCRGDGYVRLETRKVVGPCVYCEGRKKVQLNMMQDMLPEDKERLFSLFNFEKKYTGVSSSFNEGYFGFGIVCGVTDYGRYKSLSEEEFQQEVKNNLLNHYLQYTSVYKNGKFPSEILIRRGESGWFAYPVYD